MMLVVDGRVCGESPRHHLRWLVSPKLRVRQRVKPKMKLKLRVQLKVTAEQRWSERANWTACSFFSFLELSRNVSHQAETRTWRSKQEQERESRLDNKHIISVLTYYDTKKGLLFVFWSSLNLWERERKQSNPKSQSLVNYICWHRLHHEFVPNEQSGLHYFLGWSFASFFTVFYYLYSYYSSTVFPTSSWHKFPANQEMFLKSVFDHVRYPLSQIQSISTQSDILFTVGC